MSKAARKQNGTQPEVARKSKHVVLPTHDLYVGQQAMFQDPRSYKQALLPSCKWKFVSWFKKLHDNYYVVSALGEGAIQPYAASEYLAQDGHKSELMHTYNTSKLKRKLSPE